MEHTARRWRIMRLRSGRHLPALVEGWQRCSEEELTSVPSSSSPTAVRSHVHRLLLTLFTLGVAACAGKAGPSPSSDQSPPSAAAQKAADTIYIGTGGVTGVYYPTGGGICRLYNRESRSAGQELRDREHGGLDRQYRGPALRRVRHGHRPERLAVPRLRGRRPVCPSGPLSRPARRVLASHRAVHRGSARRIPASPPLPISAASGSTSATRARGSAPPPRRSWRRMAGP